MSVTAGPLPTARAQRQHESISSCHEAGSRQRGAGSREAAAGARSCQQNRKRTLSEVRAGQTHSQEHFSCRASAGPAYIRPGSFCQLPHSFSPLHFLLAGDEGKPG